MESALLHFPSSGHTAPLPCRCTIHALADGRAGLLVIAAGPSDAASEIPTEKLALAFDLLPAAAAFMGREGSLHRLNAAARLLLGADQRASLGALVEDSSLADDLLTRLASTGTVSDVRRLRTKIGQRDIRLTLQKLSATADPVAFAMVLLDDITERRALERTISNRQQGEGGVPAAKPRLAAAEAEAFHHLGKVLTESCYGSKAGAGKAEAQTGGHSARGHQRHRQGCPCGFDQQGRASAARQSEGARDFRIFLG